MPLLRTHMRDSADSMPCTWPNHLTRIPRSTSCAVSSDTGANAASGRASVVARLRLRVRKCLKPFRLKEIERPGLKGPSSIDGQLEPMPVGMRNSRL